jgi:N utilization substance protein B
MRGGAEPLREVDRELTVPGQKAPGPEIRQYTYRLLDTIERDRHRVDARIESLADNWRLSRMTTIDRNILRIAATEMLYLGEVPPRVSVHEAIMLAEWFGTEESGRFVNGVLDALLQELQAEQTSDAR